MNSIPKEFVEIESISTILKKGKVNMFLSTDKKEGKNAILVSTINYLLDKKYKILVIDFDLIKRKIFHKEKYKKIKELDINTIIEYDHIKNLKYITMENRLLNNTSKKEAIYFIKDLIESKKERYDYIFINTVPVTLLNKNNIPYFEFNHIIDDYYYVIRGNFINKIKLEKIKTEFDFYKVDVKGIIINDYKNPNIFDDFIQITRKYKKYYPNKSKKIISWLKEQKYINQL